MIFVISDEMRKKTSRSTEEVPTLQRKNSEAAWIELFQSEGDYSVFIPGRFFNIIRVDATTVTEETNKYLNNESAPSVILTRSNGEVAACFDSRAKIKRNSIVSAMCKILQQDGVVQNMQPFTRLHDLMKSLERSELDLIKADEQLQELTAKYSAAMARDAETARKTKKDVKVSVSTQNAEEAVGTFKATVIYEAECGKYDILKEEYVLLKNIGLPESKLPKEPTEPAEPQGADSSASGMRRL